MGVRYGLQLSTFGEKRHYGMVWVESDRLFISGDLTHTKTGEFRYDTREEVIQDALAQFREICQYDGPIELGDWTDPDNLTVKSGQVHIVYTYTLRVVNGRVAGMSGGTLDTTSELTVGQRLLVDSGPVRVVKIEGKVAHVSKLEG